MIKGKKSKLFLYCVSPKVLSEGVKKSLKKKFQRGIYNQKLGKVKIIQVWVV